MVRYRSFDGHFRVGRPLRVVENGPEWLVTHLAEGTVVAEPELADGRGLRGAPLSERWTHPRVTVYRAWSRADVLMLFPRNRPFSLWLFREQGTFAGWYVNLEEQHVYGDHLISTQDDILDIWVPAETGEPEWKDEDELASAITAGRITAEQAAAIRAEGERVWAERPWPTGWEEWVPPPEWTTPELPEGWDAEGHELREGV